jgi:golgi phosphoprotein 3
MLTIAEDFILLVLDPRTGDFRRLKTDDLHAGLVGASVMELALRERTDSDDETLWVLDAKPTGYDSLDLILSAMTEPGFPKDIGKIIGALMPLAERVEMNVLSKLRARKVIATGEARNLMLRKVTRHAILDAAPLRQTKERLTRMLMGEELPDPRDVCLMTLVKACGLLEEVIPKAGSAEAMERLNGFSTMDLMGKHVQRYLEGVERGAAG